MPDTSQLNYVADFLIALGAIVAFGTLIGSLIYKAHLARKKLGYKQALELIDDARMATDSKVKVKQTLESFRWINRAAFIVLAVMGTASIVILLYEPTDQATLSRYLSRHAPEVFRHSRNDLYDIARAMPNRDSLVRETDFGATLGKTEKSFDIAARHGGSITGDFQPHILKALERGVSIRVIVCDPSETNQIALDLHAKATDRPPDRVRSHSCPN